MGSPSAASAAAKTAAAAGDAAASASPMPTDCEPWPGKTKAERVIARSVSADSTLTRAGLCDLARKSAIAAMLGAMPIRHARRSAPR